MFCLLMAVYHKESPDHLATALESVLHQTVKPSQIVIVKDGPLSDRLNDVMLSYQQLLPIDIVQLPQNIGLAGALNKGLEVVREPWVARFDSDDICSPTRFAEQMAWMASNQYDLFGSQIEEFDATISQPLSQRRVPTEYYEIKKFAMQRNPFNHMTVCYRTDMVKKAGGYPSLHGMEDYALWIKLISLGARLANSKNVLVHARTGNGMIARRGGAKYICSEFKLQRLMMKQLNKSPIKAMVHFAARSFVFAIPKGLRAKIYKKYLRDGLAKKN